MAKDKSLTDLFLDTLKGVVLVPGDIVKNAEKAEKDAD